jgi:hypothetical protein
MKSNLLLKELENNVPMESLNVQFQVGRGKGAEKARLTPRGSYHVSGLRMG